MLPMPLDANLLFHSCVYHSISVCLLLVYDVVLCVLVLIVLHVSLVKVRNTLSCTYVLPITVLMVCMSWYIRHFPCILHVALKRKRSRSSASSGDTSCCPAKKRTMDEYKKMKMDLEKQDMKCVQAKSD